MPGDWDWVVIGGVMFLVLGLWMLWGPGAALLAVGVSLILAGVSGAMRA